MTKLAVDIEKIAPNISEVDNPRHLTTEYPAENHNQLEQAINYLLLSPETLSVPLYANLFSLKRVLEKNPEYLNFLFITHIPQMWVEFFRISEKLRPKTVLRLTYEVLASHYMPNLPLIK